MKVKIILRQISLLMLFHPQIHVLGNKVIYKMQYGINIIIPQRNPKKKIHSIFYIPNNLQYKIIMIQYHILYILHTNIQLFLIIK
jgi:hypothetical protein